MNSHLQALLQVLIDYWTKQDQSKALPLAVNLICDSVNRLVQDMPPDKRRQFLMLLISTLQDMGDF